MSDVYEVLNLVQGTEAWKQKRLKYVASSQVSVLLSLSPRGYQTVAQLFEEKLTGQETHDKNKEYIFKKGHQAEYSAREWIELEMGISFPQMCIVSKKCPNLFASLDGFNIERNIFFEGKLVGAESLEAIKKGKLPPHHECQVQTQLLATGADYCIYFATTPQGDSAVLKVQPNLEWAIKIPFVVNEFIKDIHDLKEILNQYEKFKVGLIHKHKNKYLAPLKVLESGAIDPFRVRAR